MNQVATIPNLQELRSFYETGATRSYAFRKQQLLLLKDILLEHEQEIYQALGADLGKCAEESYATEIGLILAEINYVLKHLHSWMKPRRATPNFVNFPSSGKMYADPLGVVLIIAPWNYPLQLSLIPLVGAIAAGNCVVLKPSELAENTSRIMHKMLSRIYKPEYVKVVEGDGSVVIPDMMQQFKFDHIFYTGSTSVGKLIYQMAAENLIPVTLELGGKSPVIVESDADINISVKRIALGKFTNAGQTCIAPDYVLVQKDIAEKFIAALAATITTFWGEDPSQSNDYARIVNTRRFDKLVSYLAEGDIIAGGKTDRSTLYFSPTIMRNIPAGAAIMKDEIFGPILPILVFNSTEEAIHIVKQHPDPLSFYLFTADNTKVEQWVSQISFGGGCINNTIWHFANHRFPFGGIGHSGIGAYHGRYSFDLFTHKKPLMKTPLWFDPGIKYPPFKGKLQQFKRLIK